MPRSSQSRTSNLSANEEAFVDAPVVTDPKCSWFRSDDGKTELSVGYAIFGRKVRPRGDIVFFHGTPGSRLDGAYLDDAASALGVRIVSIDRPGTGMSDEQPLRSIRSFSQTVQRLLRDLETPVGKCYLIAHSSGAAYALALVHIWPPERLLGVAIIAGLAPRRIAQRHLPKLVQTLLHTATYGEPELARTLVESQAALWTLGSAGERYDRMKEAFRSSSIDHEALTEPRMARIWLQSQYEAYKNTSRRNGLLTEASLLWTDWKIPLGRLQYKGIRFYYGSEDTTTKHKMGDAFAREVPYSKLITYEGAGHYSILITCGVEIIQDLLRGRATTLLRPVKLLERKPSREVQYYRRKAPRPQEEKVVYKYVKR